MPQPIRVLLFLVLAASLSGAAAAECGSCDTEQGASGVGGQEHVTIGVDCAGSYAIVSDILVGKCGVSVLLQAGGDRGQGHVNFRIAILPDGAVEVNGERVAECDPAERCRISLSWRPDTGAATLHVADAGGVVCSAQYALSAMPDEVDLAAADIGALSVVRQ